MTLNPYAAQLGSRDAMAVITETPKQLEKLAESIGKRMEQPRAPGKWNAREILCHLADCEIAFGFRFRQALGEEHHMIQPFDQDLWAKNYSSYDAKSALATFVALRKWNIALVSKLPKEGLAKKVSHPERGEMTFKIMLETMAGHDLNHRKQLEEIAGKKAAAS